ncbi:guanine nucleotide-binding protein subunit beta-like protein 1 [Condylostylus longicornis]|uniref:guanine nucleotide-binding protein subunit beta-like protein 1 n=1 Tax=Condylostylus longicornis TaxID=2530218 RepID=UPI00244E1763|nr:guanine nucleotide-binding protein subunit beta-like protein 1 [Condylostylus longicornis]
MAVLPPDPVFTLRCAEMGSVNSVCFHHNERILAGTVKGSIHLWDLQTNRPFLNFEAGTNPITYLYHAEDSLFTQEKGGNIKCWTLTNTGYELKKNYETTHIAFCKCDYIQNKDILIYPKSENSIGFAYLNDENMQEIPDLQPSETLKLGHITCLKAINRLGQDYIIAGYESGDIITWDIRSNKIVSSSKVNEFPMAIDFDVQSNRGICGSANDRLEVISFTPRQSFDIKSVNELSIKNPGINCIKIRPDQKVFVSGGWDGRIRIFSWKSLRPLAVLTEHKSGGVMDICFSSGKVSTWNANIMAAGGFDGQITLWDLYN